jgi:hypothetical protein
MFIKNLIGENNTTIDLFILKFIIMESKRICQSCSMPLSNPELLGTEKDGSPKKLYCKYCYENGQFTRPQITLEEMKTRVKNKMEEMNMDANTINMVISSLPNLKRWRKVETMAL